MLIYFIYFLIIIKIFLFAISLTIKAVNTRVKAKKLKTNDATKNIISEINQLKIFLKKGTFNIK
jgi:hypothetical protein